VVHTLWKSVKARKASYGSQHLSVTEWCAGQDVRRWPWNVSTNSQSLSYLHYPETPVSLTYSPGGNWCAESKGVWHRRRWGGWICLAVGTVSEGSPPLLEVKFTHTLIGRLGHLGMVDLFVYHFLSHLQDLHHSSKNWRGVALADKCKKGLELMLHFLEIGGKGVDINLIPYLAPTHIYHSDSCPAGLGGYSNKGFAWHYSIPQSLQFRASKYFLKFLAAIITLSIDILANCLQSGNCALLLTDSSTAKGWMHWPSAQVGERIGC
jgi:hypothetical protein